MKKKLLLLFHTYPQDSQTYILEEVNAIYNLNIYDILILVGEAPNGHATKYKPYTLITCIEDLLTRAIDFNPDVIHTHYIHMIPLAETIAQKCNAYYTIRTHSYDVLGSPYAPLSVFCDIAKSDRCLRILSFPLCVQMLIENGVPYEKIIECYPVINYNRFAVDPNLPHKETNVLLNVGAAIKKKNFEEFIDLANLINNNQENNEDVNEDINDDINDDINNEDIKYKFNLYALGYDVNNLKKYNAENGEFVDFYATQPENMGSVYKNSDWLIYTADILMPTVGWPLAIAEAQASGIGVIWKNMPGREKFSEEYLGGAGFLFNNISEIPNIIKNGYSDSMRRIGIEHAKKSDISRHLYLLTDVWDSDYISHLEE